MALADRIKEARGTKTQPAFARELGVSVRAVQYWEAGERKPEVDQLRKLCEVTGLSSTHFIFGVEEKVA